MLRCVTLIVVVSVIFGAEIKHTSNQNECIFEVSRTDLGSPQPIYLKDGDFLKPTYPRGIVLAAGENVLIACVGPERYIRYEDENHGNVLTLSCVSSTTVASDVATKSSLVNYSCNQNSEVTVLETEETCYNGNSVISVGYVVDGVFHMLYKSCFDKKRMEVIYAWTKQTEANYLSQSDQFLEEWSAGDFFEGVNVNLAFEFLVQRQTLSELLGNDLGNTFISHDNFLWSHRLVSSHNFVFQTGQRAAYQYINSAPYWFWLSKGWDYRGKIMAARFASNNYDLYSGNHGILQLRNSDSQLVDIYLHKNETHLAIPVPLYAYWVLYEESTKLGTAFVCVNNPYATQNEFKGLEFCQDRCRTSAFDWLSAAKPPLQSGHCFCCDVNDFRRTVTSLPDFTVEGLLTGSSVTAYLSKYLLLMLAFVVFK